MDIGKYRSDINNCVINDDLNGYLSIKQQITENDQQDYKENVNIFLEIMNLVEGQRITKDNPILLCCQYDRKEILNDMLNDGAINRRYKRLIASIFVNTCIKNNNIECLKLLHIFYVFHGYRWSEDYIQDFLKNAMDKANLEIFAYIHEFFCSKMGSGRIKVMAHELLYNYIHKIKSKFRSFFTYIVTNMLETSMSRIILQDNFVYVRRLFNNVKHNIENIKWLIDSYNGYGNKYEIYEIKNLDLYKKAIEQGDIETIKKCLQYNPRVNNWCLGRFDLILTGENISWLIDVLIECCGKEVIYEVISKSDFQMTYYKLFDTSNLDIFKQRVENYGELLNNMLSYAYMDFLLSYVKLEDNIYYKYLLESGKPTIHDLLLNDPNNKLMRMIGSYSHEFCLEKSNHYNYNLIKLSLYPSVIKKNNQTHYGSMEKLLAIYTNIINPLITIPTHIPIPTLAQLGLSNDEKISLDYELLCYISNIYNSTIIDHTVYCIINQTNFTLKTSGDTDNDVIEKVKYLMSYDRRRRLFIFMVNNDYLKGLFTEYPVLRQDLTIHDQNRLDGIDTFDNWFSLSTNTNTRYRNNVVDDTESSMRALTKKEEIILEKLKKKYPVNNGDFELFRNELIKCYNEDPIIFNGIKLPLDYKSFTALKLIGENKKLALESYYQHTVHTVIRWISKPNHWLDPHADFAYGLEGSKYSCFEDCKDLFLLFWKAATDTTLKPEEQCQDCFLRTLASINRAHNWDKSKIVNGRKVEYDDLKGDNPSCLMGIRKRLFTSIPDHPFFVGYSMTDEQQQINSFVHNYYKTNQIFQNNKDEIRTIVDEYFILFDKDMEDKLKQYNIPDDQIAKLIQDLDDDTKITKNSDIHMVEFYNLLFD